MKQKKCNWCEKVVDTDDVESALWTKVKLDGKRYDYCPECVPVLKAIAAGLHPDTNALRRFVRGFDMLSKAVNKWMASADPPHYRDNLLGQEVMNVYDFLREEEMREGEE